MSRRSRLLDHGELINFFVLHKSRWYQRTRHNPLERSTMRRTDTKIPHPVPSHLVLCYNMIIYLKLRTCDYSIYLSQELFQSSTCLRSFLHCPDRDWNIYSALELKKTHFHSDRRSISGGIVCALRWPQRNWSFAWSLLAFPSRLVVTVVGVGCIVEVCVIEGTAWIPN